MSKSILGVLLLAFLFSCKKDSIPQSPDNENKYFPLDVGNYWIYQHFEMDTNGNATALNRTDSITITGDTLINGKEYFILRGRAYPENNGIWGTLNYLRDSAGCIVNEHGSVLFAPNNYQDTLGSTHFITGGDTLYSIYYQMKEGSQSIEVPAGYFNSLVFQEMVVAHIPIPNVAYPRFLNTHYANHVGKIIQPYAFLSSPKWNEKRLIRYHLE